LRRLIGVWLIILVLVAGVLALTAILPPSNMLSYEIDGEVYLYDLRTGVASPMYAINQDRATTEAWSPGMRWRAYLYQGRNRYRLRITDTWGRTHSETEIPLPMDTPVGIHIPYLLWSPDSETLAVSISVSAQEEAPDLELLTIVYSDGEQAYQDIQRGRIERRLSWSPNSLYLAETGYLSTENELYQSWVNIIDTEEGEVNEIQPPIDRMMKRPTDIFWSSDSRRVSFRTLQSDLVGYQLFAVETDAKIAYHIKDHFAPDNPTWQGNSIRIGTDDGRLLTYDIMTMELVDDYDTGLGVVIYPIYETENGLIFGWINEGEPHPTVHLGVYHDDSFVVLNWSGRAFPNMVFSPSGRVIIIDSDKFLLNHLEANNLQPIVGYVPRPIVGSETIWSHDSRWIASSNLFSLQHMNANPMMPNTSTVYVVQPDGTRLSQASPVGSDIRNLTWYDPH
jgi:hypothetical protein